jgi:3-hydroxy acid dehydrogenase/malonic semialdehyde reductase
MKILITGATSGFGKAIAERFAASGHELWLSGRRLERLELIQAALRQQFDIPVFISSLDVRNKKSVEHMVAELSQQWPDIDVLVNNAGLALGTSSIEEGDMEDWDTMIDTNVKGLLYVTRTIAPLMCARCSGHIINIGSTAGTVAYRNGNVYCATKFAVDALTQSMRIDLLPYNIKVTAINPGMAETEFSLVRFKGNEDSAASVYKGYNALQAEDIADAVFYCATLPPHVCINDMTLTCTQQANSIYKQGV